MTPPVGLSLMLDDDFRTAALPLFEEGVVEALEWSFDLGWGPSGVPPWAEALLGHFGDAGRLFGHGVHFSPLSARWEPRQQWWIERFAEECEKRRFQHISEHFGFMTARGFERGSPLPMPCTAASIAIGRERLERMAELAHARVGLENLAFAFGRHDVEAHGGFLRALLEPMDGFVVLDLHNLYCQIENFASGSFDETADALLARFPLERVRELHVSGGSWSEAEGARFRRDTHDDAVPSAVLALLPRVLARAPNVEVVIVERLGGTILDERAAERFRADFLEVSAIVRSAFDA